MVQFSFKDFWIFCTKEFGKQERKQRPLCAFWACILHPWKSFVLLIKSWTPSQKSKYFGIHLKSGKYLGGNICFCFNQLACFCIHEWSIEREQPGSFDSSDLVASVSPGAWKPILHESGTWIHCDPHDVHSNPDQPFWVKEFFFLFHSTTFLSNVFFGQGPIFQRICWTCERSQIHFGSAVPLRKFVWEIGLEAGGLTPERKSVKGREKSRQYQSFLPAKREEFIPEKRKPVSFGSGQWNEWT